MDRSCRPRTGHYQIPQLAAVPLRLGSDAVPRQYPHPYNTQRTRDIRTRGLQGHDGRPCGHNGGAFRAGWARARPVGPAKAEAAVPAVQVQNEGGGGGRCGPTGETCEREGNLDWRPYPGQKIVKLKGVSAFLGPHPACLGI